MRPLRRSFLCLACALLANLPLATAENPWMSEEAMRADFAGKRLEGYYYFSVTWTATFDEGGRYQVGEREPDGRVLEAQGRWYFRGQAFCLFYGPPSWLLLERCSQVRKISSNCYEFHLVWPDGRPRDEGGAQPQPLWHSRGWRQGEPSTCETNPVG